MLSRIGSRLTFANTMSLIAVFIALGGTGYAAVNLPRNSVGNRQIRNNAVTGGKVKNGSLQAGDFKAGDLPAGRVGAAGPVGPIGPVGPMGATGAIGETGAKGANGTNGADGKDGTNGMDGAPGTNGMDGAPGTNGMDGAPGTPGADGAPGVVGTVTVQRTDVTLPAGPNPSTPGDLTSAFAGCPAGQKIIGGSVNGGDPIDAVILISRPSLDEVDNGGVPNDNAEFAFWKGTGRARANADETMRVFAICAEAP
jgi:hypothetical protein